MAPPRASSTFQAMSPMEGRSLVKGGALLLVLAVVRVGVEAAGKGPPVLEAGSDQLEDLLRESRGSREEELLRKRPLAPGERLDPNRAPEEALDRLPGVGPAVARATVTYREREGGFLNPEDLLQIPGIGPATLERIRPFLDFSRWVPVELRRGTAAEGESPRSPRESRPLLAPSAPVSGAPPLPVDVNRASARELQKLPGIGPALAQRILRSRRGEGPFRTPEDLLRVPGIGPVTLERLRNRILTGG